MTQRTLVPFLGLLMLAPIALLGCESAPRDETANNSYWVPGAREAFTTIDADTVYAIVPDHSHDVYIHEAKAGSNARLTWIVRVPRDAPLDEPIVLSDERDHASGAWLLEEVAGEPSALVPASGSIVLHARSDDVARATVVLEAVAKSLVAGKLSPETLALTHRGAWVRNVRNPIAKAPKETRSGVNARDEIDANDPYSQESRIAR
jgi:hypothetical protein